MNRKQISELFIEGTGLEIGSLHNPWPVPGWVNLLNVDRYTKEELEAQYPELAGKEIKPTDIVDDGQYLKNVPDESKDFVLNSHVFEHTENPLQTLKDWLRVVRTGGVVVMAIPEKNYTFDKPRPVTPFDELESVFKDPSSVSERKRRIYKEWIKNIDKLDDKKAQEKFEKMVKENAHVHFNVWTIDGMREFFSKAGAIIETSYRIELMELVGIEVFVVLRKLKISEAL